MRLRHWRAARRTHPSTAGPPGARRPRTGRRTSRTTSLRQKPAGDLVREGQGTHHAGFFRSCGGVVVLHRRGGGSLSARLSSPASGGMKSRPPVWVKCLVASNGLLEDRPGGQPSRYLRSAARRTAMVTDQVLAARYRSCSVRPPACQASQRPAESPQSDDACSPAPPRCSHAHNGTEHAMPIRFPASAAPAPSSANPVPLKEERWNLPPPARRPSATMSRPCTPGACPG
jgi:hypothetical protein